MNVDVIIEIPMNTSVKYEYDEEYKMMRCDRILKSSMVYPANYGYVPKTLAKDGDALDAVVICDFILQTNTIIKCVIIGVLIMEDEKGMDEKIIVIPDSSVDSSYKHIANCSELGKYQLDRLKNFFESYKTLDEDKWTKVYRYEDSEFAYNLYEKYKTKI